MKSIFDPENGFWSFLNKLTDVLFLNILWLIFCLPIITIGASTTAMFQYTLKLAKNEEGYVAKTFFKAFKNNFLKASLLWIGMILISAILYIDAYICLQINNLYGNILFFAIVCISLLFLIACLYVFPILALFEMKLKRIIKDAFIMGIGNLHITISIIVLILIAVFLLNKFPILIFFMGGFIAYISSYLYQMVFEKYMKD